ncbi:MAG: peptidase [Burkholderiales bacterium]|nr:peptidase [Burkholderiales bacterium]
MTYCVGIRLKSGTILASDSRTSAGVDYISVFSKTHRFSVAGEREIFLLTAGNLATTQEVISILKREIQENSEGNILQLKSLFDVANKVGNTVIKVLDRLPTQKYNHVDFGCSFLIGGQIKGESQRLFRVYSEGNFIEVSKETPFFQIGESKYGKPMLDRIISYDTNIEDALKCVLVSFDSTMRSNLSVGLPINLYYLPVALNNENGSEDIKEVKSAYIDENHTEFKEISQHWTSGLQKLFGDIPNQKWWD